MKFGYVRYGCSLLIMLLVGLTQGSPLSPGVADIVMVVVDSNNEKVFILQSSIFLLLLMRWVDDVYWA